VNVSEFDFTEIDDLNSGGHSLEIIDDEPDYERRRASIHRGAAYLQAEGYPPFGTSSGQEGGAPNREETVIEVFGHRGGDSMWQRGMDALAGATRGKKPSGPPRGFVVKTAPGTGRKYTALVVGPAKDHKTSVANAKAAAKRAVSIGKKLQAALSHPATKIHGASSHRHARASLKQMKAAAANAQKLGKDLSGHADKHVALIKTTASATTAGVRRVQSATAPGSTGFHGDVVHGTWSAAHRHLVSEVLGLDSAPPDPNSPGYLTDGSPDPNYQSDSSSTGGSGTLDPSLDPAQNYGLPPPPTAPPPLQPGVDFAPDSSLPGGGYQNDDTVYHSGGDITKVVNGAVIYDGSHPLNTNDVTSFVAVYGPSRGGAGTGEGVEPEPVGSQDYNMGLKWRGGFRFKNDGWHYNWGGDNQSGTEGGDKKKMGAGPHHWGPLVGNPQTDFRGLRYDVDTDTFFWPRDLAPSWATMKDDQTRLAQAILDYKTQYTTAAANAAARMAQDALDAKTASDLVKKQAAEDAQHQRDMDKQAQSAELTASQQATQQGTFDQQQAQTQAQLDLDAQKQQQALDFQQRQTEADYYRAHPEQLYAQPQGGGGYVDQGGPGDDVVDPDVARAVLEEDDSDSSDSVQGWVRGSDRVRAHLLDR
jgi:hypothetical protein